MNIMNVLVAICSILFLMIGVDKFFPFMEPPCTLMDRVSPTIWKLFGVLQLAAGILIWLPQFRRYVAGFFAVFMLAFTIVHLLNNTYDIGGSVFMAVVLGLIAWNPSFLRNQKK